MIVISDTTFALNSNKQSISKWDSNKKELSRTNMCGITGIVNLDGSPVDKNVLKKMTDSISHRGPDDEGFYLNHISTKGALPFGKFHEDSTSQVQQPTVALGHRRLSIIDISTGQQPQANEDYSVWIVFNGEIYNYLDLKKELISRGHTFRTNSDTEAIIHAYEEWSVECPKKLRGMFAFAIWDKKLNRLFMARDRLGIKPLYYYQSNGTLIFGSEIKTILANSGVLRDLNLQALYDYFSLLYVPAPKTIFNNMYKLPAGHSLTFDEGELKIKQFWDLKFNQRVLSETDWCEKVIEKLKESVDIRLMSEVPLGAFLSGGVDSSAIVALMSELVTAPIKTSSIGFSEKKLNELPYANQVAKLFNTEHHTQIITPNAVDVLDKLVWFFDEPFADSSAVPTYYVSEAARQKVIVCLSGDGGDENFAGYRRYYFDVMENKMRDIFPKSIRKNIFGSLAAVYPKLDWAPQVFRAKTFLKNIAMSPEEGFFNSMSWFNDIRDRLINKDQHKQLADYSPLSVFQQHFQNAPKDPLLAIQYVDIKTYLVDDILTKVDRASMAHSLEVRVPLLDHEFMEMAAQIPPGLKLKAKEGKYLFKKALEKKLPKDILYRSKMGFSIPLSQWFKNELKPVFEDTVLDANALSNKYLDPGTVKQLWNEHQSGSRERSAELWSILFFEKWLRQWL